MTVSKKYSIQQKYIKKGNSRSGAKLVNGGKPTFVVSHETANNSADALAHFKYFNKNQPSASAHTFIDDERILEIVPIDEKAWHNRYDNPEDNRMFGEDANDSAIGVELCRTGDFKKAYDKYVWYHAYLCRKFGLNPKNKIVAHKTLDPRRRSDPESWLNPNGITWNKFIVDVVEYYNEWENNKTTPPTPQFQNVNVTKKYSTSELEKLVNSSPYGLIDTPFTGSQRGKHVLAMKVAMSKLGFGYHFKQYGVNDDFNQETYDGLRAVQWHLKDKNKLNIDLNGVFDNKTRNAFIQLLEERRFAIEKARKESKKEDMYRVVVNGKQVGAYVSDNSIMKAVEDALKDDESKIEIEKV